MKGNVGYQKGDKFICAGNKVVPVPLKYQTGPVTFSNRPDNPIVGLEKLNNLKVR